MSKYTKHFIVFSQEELDKIKKWRSCSNRRFSLVQGKAF